MTYFTAQVRISHSVGEVIYFRLNSKPKPLFLVILPGFLFSNDLLCKLGTTEK